jgi:hypothetical protein
MDIKYIGMDIHKETISIAVMIGDGRVVAAERHRSRFSKSATWQEPGR